MEAIWQNFMDIMTKKYVDFNGRARRREYWYFILMYMIIYIGLMILSAFSETLGSILILLFALGIMLPSLAAAARRLHDTDRSAWWLVAGIIPLVNFVVLVFLCLEGTPGPNRFGPNPKANDPQPQFT